MFERVRIEKNKIGKLPRGDRAQVTDAVKGNCRIEGRCLKGLHGSHTGTDKMWPAIRVVSPTWLVRLA